MSAQTVPVQLVSVFNIAIGAPITLSECPFMRAGSSVIYNPPEAAPCFEYIDGAKKGSGAVPVNDTVKVAFPFQQRPELVSGLYVIVGIIDGNVQSVGFNTPGYETQERDLGTLTKKFGAPASLVRPELQNAYGAQYVGVQAQWNLQDHTTVYFDSMQDGLATGFVRVETPTSAVRRKQALDNLRQARTKL